MRLLYHKVFAPYFLNAMLYLMAIKTIKFRDNLAKMVLAGEKNSTFRLFDDKDLKADDEVGLINWNTGEKFADAVIIEVKEQKLRNMTVSDYEGHEKFESEEKMYEAYREYYGDKVTPETLVKIIKFKLL